MIFISTGGFSGVYFIGGRSHSIEAVHTKTYASTDEIVSNTKDKLQIALVVTQEPLLTLADSYRKEMTGNLFEHNIFQTLEEAREWVGSN